VTRKPRQREEEEETWVLKSILRPHLQATQRPPTRSHLLKVAPPRNSTTLGSKTLHMSLWGSFKIQTEAAPISHAEKNWTIFTSGTNRLCPEFIANSMLWESSCIIFQQFSLTKALRRRRNYCNPKEAVFKKIGIRRV
jgi:hypothetical protein